MPSSFCHNGFIELTHRCPNYTLHIDSLHICQPLPGARLVASLVRARPHVSYQVVWFGCRKNYLFCSISRFTFNPLLHPPHYSEGLFSASYSARSALITDSKRLFYVAGYILRMV